MFDANYHKWCWMMEYCKKNKLPPAQTYAWEEAEKEYNKEYKNNKGYKIKACSK